MADDDILTRDSILDDYDTSKTKTTVDDSILTEDQVQKAVNKIMAELKKQKDKEDEDQAREEQRRLAAESATPSQMDNLPGVPLSAPMMPGVPGAFGAQPQDQTLDIRRRGHRRPGVIRDATDWSLWQASMKSGRANSLASAGSQLAQGWRNPVLPDITKSYDETQNVIPQDLRDRVKAIGRLASQTEYINRYLIGRQSEGTA